MLLDDGFCWDSLMLLSHCTVSFPVHSTISVIVVSTAVQCPRPNHIMLSAREHGNVFAAKVTQPESALSFTPTGTKHFHWGGN